jgi:hypothetical protein
MSLTPQERKNNALAQTIFSYAAVTANSPDFRIAPWKTSPCTSILRGGNENCACPFGLFQARIAQIGLTCFFGYDTKS